MFLVWGFFLTCIVFSNVGINPRIFQELTTQNFHDVIHEISGSPDKHWHYEALILPQSVVGYCQWDGLHSSFSGISTHVDANGSDVGMEDLVNSMSSLIAHQLI